VRFGRKRTLGLSLVLLVICAPMAQARHHGRHAEPQQLSVSSINEARLSGEKGRGAARAVMLKAEVLLDRLALAPGVIDGKAGDNVRRALAAFQQIHGLASTGNLDQATWEALAATFTEPVVVSYTISADDVRGPFTARIPGDLKGKARLPYLGYHNAADLLAEKFHTSPELLSALNPRTALDQAGHTIFVPNVGPRALGAVARIEVDKPRKLVRALDRGGNLIAQYPASIGSVEKPAPSGTFAVRRVARDPEYHYDPRFKFRGVKTNRKLTIARGPRNPVGVVWIDLTKPSYGIHGTPAPEKIGKTASHGCIRLTNWDALDLADRVRRGVAVAFLDAVAPPTLTRSAESNRHSR
jgi:lipoprotein-anchoring transpeptidase ErfK/SrfK